MWLKVDYETSQNVSKCGIRRSIKSKANLEIDQALKISKGQTFLPVEQSDLLPLPVQPAFCAASCAANCAASNSFLKVQLVPDYLLLSRNATVLLVPNVLLKTETLMVQLDT